MNFFETFISPKAVELVNKCMTSERLSAGSVADEFEKALSSEFGIVNPVSVNSGTSALHLAMILAGVSKGDEVILPAQTFIATGLAVLYVGATPVFCDINIYDGNIDILDAERRITPKTKAIIAVHWGGYPCDMGNLIDLGKSYNIKVIEDAAHAIGACYCGSSIGSISDITIFSFQAIKHLTTGDGGAVCCKNIKDYQLAKNLRWFDIDRDKSKPDVLGERVYDATHIGYKYHMNDFAASMGLGNIPYIQYNLKEVRYIASLYNKELKNISGLTLMSYTFAGKVGSYWLYPVLVEKRENFIRKLKESGIPTSIVHKGIDRNSIFGGKRTDLPIQRFFDDHLIHIPINYKLTDEEVFYIIKKIKEGW